MAIITRNNAGFAAVASLTAEQMGVLLCQGFTVQQEGPPCR